MKQDAPKYRYVTLNDPMMRFAYDMAKGLYNKHGWNQKACPVAVLVQDGLVMSWAASADGAHQLRGYCKRQNMRGSVYSACEWCVQSQHAESLALERASYMGNKPTQKSMYMYGHWHMCVGCLVDLRSAGVEDLVLLEGSDVLFDRHNPKTVIGKAEQFSL